MATNSQIILSFILWSLLCLQTELTHSPAPFKKYRWCTKNVFKRRRRKHHPSMLTNIRIIQHHSKTLHGLADRLICLFRVTASNIFGTRYLSSSLDQIKTFLLIKHFPSLPPCAPSAGSIPLHTARTERGLCNSVTFPSALMWWFCSPHGHVGSPLLTDVWCSRGSVVSVLRASDWNIGSCQRTVRSVAFKRSAVLGLCRFGWNPFFFDIRWLENLNPWRYYHNTIIALRVDVMIF